jgi:hypothetical protein
VGDFKSMSYSEKYDIVSDSIRFGERLTQDFVRRNLGDQASADLRQAYQDVLEPIPEDASAEEKYEAAYGNWHRLGTTNFGFIRERLGEEGIDRFVDLEVEALVRKNASPTLLVLSVIRALAPRTAFSMTAKEFAYRLQWITPYSVSEISSGKVVFDIPRCKVLDHPQPDDLCQIGCQRVYPMWVARQFKVRMELEPQGHRCTCTVTPLS